MILDSDLMSQSAVTDDRIIIFQGQNFSEMQDGIEHLTDTDIRKC